MAGYGMSREVDLPFSEAVERTRAALADQGFGILTEIDVKATFRKKLDVDFRDYVILGACNPPYAHQALTAELAIGLLLPCNVVVHATDEPGKSMIRIIDPEVQLAITGRDDIAPMAAEIKAKLSAALAAI